MISVHRYVMVSICYNWPKCISIQEMLQWHDVHDSGHFQVQMMDEQTAKIKHFSTEKL